MPPVTARLPAVATRVRRLAPAAAPASVLKAARCLWHAASRREALLDAGIISKCKYGVKFLGNGEVSKKLTVKAAAFSETAKQKIEAAGGKAEVV